MAPRVLGPPSGVPSPSGQDELYGCRAASSNRDTYPVGIPVLTWPNQFDAGGSHAPRDAVVVGPGTSGRTSGAGGPRDSRARFLCRRAPGLAGSLLVQAGPGTSGLASCAGGRRI